MVDSSLLLNKLRLYGFSTNSIDLISDYFKDRSQLIKVNQTYSNPRNIKLGVPQGSVLGPLFFLLFINDLPNYLRSFKSFLFADDTSLFLENNNLHLLLEDFNKSVKYLIDWCAYNRLDINWDKTEIMIVTKKRNINIPSSIMINNIKINVVDKFKLLGIIIDNKLNFQDYLYELKMKINKRLYSIKRLFYLPKEVKTQFFKTFIIPYFDYCSTLTIYFPKPTIQKIFNLYNFCLYKLLKINTRIENSTDYNKLNIHLETFGLSSYQHRLLKRLMYFSYNILNGSSSVKNLLIKNDDLNKGYNLRNLNRYSQPSLLGKNRYGDETFEYFFSKFINEFSLMDIGLKFETFKIRVHNNINIIFDKFIKINTKFDLYYKDYKSICKKKKKKNLINII